MTTRSARATGTYALKARWDKAEEALQRAWDADNRRSTDATRSRLQRAWDKAQQAKHAYEQALGGTAHFYDNYEPDAEG